MSDVFKDENSEFVPKISISVFIIGIAGTLLATIYWYSTYQVSKTNWFFNDVYYNIDSIFTVFADEKLDARKFTIFSGFICGVAFYTAFFFYLISYITKIWNNYFVFAGDDFWFQVFLGIYTVLFPTTVMFPQYWHWGILGLFIVISCILLLRWLAIASRIRSSGRFHLQNGMVMILWKGTLKRDNKASAKYNAIKRAFLNFTVKGCMFGIPMTILLILFHSIRGYATEELDLIYAGAYSALSAVVSMLSVLSMYMRSKHTLKLMKSRIDSGDVEFFSHLSR